MSDRTIKITLAELRNIIRECLQEDVHDKSNGKDDVILEEPPMDEVAPPGREDQVKALKKEKGVKNPWAIAWASYNKSHKK